MQKQQAMKRKPLSAKSHVGYVSACDQSKICYSLLIDLLLNRGASQDSGSCKISLPHLRQTSHLKDEYSPFSARMLLLNSQPCDHGFD